MNRYPPNTIPFDCERCQESEHVGPHRCLVNAGMTAMFWGNADRVSMLVEDAHQSPGPGIYCEPNASGDAVIFLWLNEEHERVIAERYWGGVTDHGVRSYLAWRGRQ